MFNFFSMLDNYEQRKVGRLDAEWGYISTAEVNDAEKPYETAVRHREYNDGKLVIVEPYNTREEAEHGHQRWVEVMTANTLPAQLIDRGLSGINAVCDMFGGEDWRVCPRQTDAILEAEVIGN